MTHYAWTIEAEGRRPIRKVTTMDELIELLRVLDLPGVPAPGWLTLEDGTTDHGGYTHNEGGDDQWSLRWTKVGTPE